jgi:hypothetical protein
MNLINTDDTGRVGQLTVIPLPHRSSLPIHLYRSPIRAKWAVEVPSNCLSSSSIVGRIWAPTVTPLDPCNLVASREIAKKSWSATQPGVCDNQHKSIRDIDIPRMESAVDKLVDLKVRQTV